MSEGRRKGGFAAMDPARRREIASKGGKSAHVQKRAHEFTSEAARAAGKKGGTLIAQRPGHMAAIGRLGGRKASASAEPGYMAKIGRLGGEATARRLADDDEEP